MGEDSDIREVDPPDIEERTISTEFGVDTNEHSDERTESRNIELATPRSVEPKDVVTDVDKKPPHIHLGFVEYDVRTVTQFLERHPDSYSRIILFRQSSTAEQIVRGVNETVTKKNSEIQWKELETLDYKTTHSALNSLITDQLAEEGVSEVSIDLSNAPSVWVAATLSVVTELLFERSELRETIELYHNLNTVAVASKLLDNLYESQQLLKNFYEDSETNTELQQKTVSDLIQSNQEILNQLTQPNVADQIDRSGQFDIIPAIPQPNIENQPNQIRILNYLYEVESVESVSELARRLAERQGVDLDESFRSSVQHNTRSLENKGYVKREKSGQNYQTTLTKAGEIWIENRE